MSISLQRYTKNHTVDYGLNITTNILCVLMTHKHKPVSGCKTYISLPSPKGNTCLLSMWGDKRRTRRQKNVINLDLPTRHSFVWAQLMFVTNRRCDGEAYACKKLKKYFLNYTCRPKAIHQNHTTHVMCERVSRLCFTSFCLFRIHKHFASNDTGFCWSWLVCVLCLK